MNTSPQSPTEIRCVCFDWGGVILRICRSFAEGVRAAGLELRTGSDDPALVAKRHDLAQQFQIGKLGRPAFLAQISESMDHSYSPEEFERIHDSWLLEEYAGVDALVNELNALPHVQTAMLSNTNELHWARQHPIGGKPHFPTAGRLRHRHASHVLGLAKPDTAIYRAFETQTGFAPSHILFFDDLEENVAAAKSCGWNSERIDHTGDTASQMRAHLRRYGVL